MTMIKDGIWDLQSDPKMDFGTFMKIQKLIWGCLGRFEPSEWFKNWFRDLQSYPKIDFWTFTEIQNWILGHSKCSKHGFWDLRSGPKIDFGTFEVIQKKILGPSKWSKNGFWDLHRDPKMDFRGSIRPLKTSRCLEGLHWSLKVFWGRSWVSFPSSALPWFPCNSSRKALLQSSL